MMTKLGTKMIVASVAAAGIYGGSLYAFASGTARSNHLKALQQAALEQQQARQAKQVQLTNQQNQLSAMLQQQQEQIAVDKKAITQLKDNLKTVQSHTAALLQQREVLLQAQKMLQQGTPVSTVVKLTESGNVSVQLPSVQQVTVQQVKVSSPPMSSTPPPVTTVSRGSGVK